MNRLVPLFLLLTPAISSCTKTKKIDMELLVGGGASAIGTASVKSVSPLVVTEGTLVTITGSNFGNYSGNIAITFNGVDGIIRSVTEQEIMVLVPATASGDINIKVRDQNISGPAFTYKNAAVITGISPVTGPVGTLLTINGNKFDKMGKFNVLIGGVEAAIHSSTGEEIRVTVPAASDGHISVVTASQVIMGPEFIYSVPPKITGISPAAGIAGTPVTISGSNFGFTTDGVHILFNGLEARITSVTPGEIKVIAPAATTGSITAKFGSDEPLTGPVFTFNNPMEKGYVEGSVTLSSQADVDQFVALNKGKQLKITGALFISGADITSLSGLSNIVSLTHGLFIKSCPILTEISLNISTASGIFLDKLGATSIKMNHMEGAILTIEVTNCKNLQHLSLNSISNVTGITPMRGINITGCEKLSDLDFSSLKSVKSNLTIRNTSLADFSKLNALESTGSLIISGNASLSSLRGLENLTSLTLPPLTRVMNGAIINGLDISGNSKLNSIAALRNLVHTPLMQIANNKELNDLCVLKALATKLSTVYSYGYNSSDAVGRFLTRYVAPLTLAGNGNNSNGLEAFAGCNNP